MRKETVFKNHKKASLYLGDYFSMYTHKEMIMWNSSDDFLVMGILYVGKVSWKLLEKEQAL